MGGPGSGRRATPKEPPPAPKPKAAAAPPAPAPAPPPQDWSHLTPKELGPIDIYRHGGHSGFGLRVDLPGRERIDMDGHDPTELGEACALRMLRLLQRHTKHKEAVTVTQEFVVVDRCRTFEPGKSEGQVLRRFQVQARLTTRELPESHST